MDDDDGDDGDDEEVDEYQEDGIKVEKGNEGDVMQKVVMMKPLGARSKPIYSAQVLAKTTMQMLMWIQNTHLHANSGCGWCSGSAAPLAPYFHAE